MQVTVLSVAKQILNLLEEVLEHHGDLAHRMDALEKNQQLMLSKMVVFTADQAALDSTVADLRADVDNQLSPLQSQLRGIMDRLDKIEQAVELEAGPAASLKLTLGKPTPQ